MGKGKSWQGDRGSGGGLKPEDFRIPEKVKPQGDLTPTQKLDIAMRDSFLPQVDFHGKFPEDVPGEIDELIHDRSGEHVRIVYGNGKGVISAVVLSRLKSLLKAGKILAYREDPNRPSCVVAVK